MSFIYMGDQKWSLIWNNQIQTYFSKDRERKEWENDVRQKEKGEVRILGGR